MPIRSPRGRAAAYRAVWSWPLRSPLRLAVTAAVVLCLVVLVGAAVRATAPDRPSTPGGTGASSTSGGRSPRSVEPTALPPVAPLTPTTLPLSAAPPAALQTAREWVAAWADHPDGTTNAQWLAGLRPYTSDEYLGTLTDIDPANIPATKVTGAVQPVQVAPASVTVDVPTDALTLQVLVVKTDAGWRVAGYDRA